MKAAFLTLTIYASRSGWRWHLKTANQRIVAASTEGYLERRKAIKNVRLVTGIIFEDPRGPGTYVARLNFGAPRTFVS